jgi:hypothetical protein
MGVIAIVPLPAATLRVSMADAPTAQVTAIHCGHLVDVIAGKVLGATTIIVEGKRVREVVAGSGASRPASSPMWWRFRQSARGHQPAEAGRLRHE